MEDIRAEKAAGRCILAVKGAYDFLVSNGIVPDAFLSLETRDRPVKSPQKATTFLIASRCPPSLFDSLADYKVLAFHTWDGKEPAPELQGKPLLTGGSTSGLRAVTAGYIWGFRKFRMYGYDSCIREDNVKRFSGESVEEEKTLRVQCGGRWFKCNGAMALQAQDYRDMLRLMQDCRFEAKGDGLIAQITQEFYRMKAAA